MAFSLDSVDFTECERVPNMFSMATTKPHSIRKRMVSNVYSKSYLQSSPELHKISEVILYDRLFPLLEKAAAGNQPVEVLELNSSIAMDFIMAFIFGLQNGTNFLQDVEARKHWLKTYQSRRPCKRNPFERHCILHVVISFSKS